MSNRKRIEKLEIKLGIEKDNPDTDYWKEINSCVCECLTCGMAGKPFVLPDYLKFAEDIFHRVLNIFKNLYINVLECRKKKREGNDEDNERIKTEEFHWIQRWLYWEQKLYKTLSQIGSSPTAKFLKDKLFLSCPNLDYQVIRYIYSIEYPDNLKLFYIGAKKFQYW